MTDFPETRWTLLAQVRSPEDGEAWEQFVVIYRPVIYRMARRRGMQDADAQDLAQSVLLRISKAIGRWERSSEQVRFRHWLRRVAKNAIVSALTRTPPDAPRGGSDVLDAAPDRPVPLERELDREATRERYLRAAAIVRGDVKPETWSAFERTVIQGLSCDAVAEALDQSVGAVYAARSRVMRRLRDQVSKLEESDR